jgi:hypothetical protein
VLNAGESLDRAWFESHAAALGLAANLRFTEAKEGLWLPELMGGM